MNRYAGQRNISYREVAQKHHPVGLHGSNKLKGHSTMQGEKIGESQGKVTCRRVVNSDRGPKMETSFDSTGRLLGVEETETGTYWSVVRPDGSVHGEGQGIVMGKGGELATWTGQGVGTIRTDGGVGYRGAIYYQTSSPAWSRLNSVAVIFEYEVDAQGNTRAQLWEWK